MLLLQKQVQALPGLSSSLARTAREWCHRNLKFQVSWTTRRYLRTPSTVFAGISEMHPVSPGLSSCPARARDKPSWLDMLLLQKQVQGLKGLSGSFAKVRGMASWLDMLLLQKRVQALVGASVCPARARDKLSWLDMLPVVEVTLIHCPKKVLPWGLQPARTVHTLRHSVWCHPVTS